MRNFNKRRLSAATGKTLPVLTAASMLCLSASLVAAEPAIDKLALAANTPAPNLMYIHDDSGSMLWSFLPDEVSQATNAYVSSDYNRIYYNPLVQYRVPVDHNGEPLVAYEEIDFNNAPIDGYGVSSKAKVNLATNYRPYWAERFATNPRFTRPQRAYYSVFTGLPGCMKGTAQGGDRCYEIMAVSPEQEKNFAIWFSFYRDRNNVAKSGVSLAFSMLGENIRVGYSQINAAGKKVDGSSAILPGVQRGVRKFSGDERKQFYDWLFGLRAVGSTPLRKALDAVGRYYSLSGSEGPWSSTPGVSGGEMSPCRKSYALLMTDGYYNDMFSGLGDVDLDGYANTLGDIAQYYWQRDLMPGLENLVPTSARDSANWQHMTTFTVGFGLSGTIDPAYAFANPDLVRWPNPFSYGVHKVDDMLHAAVNGRGGFYSVYEPATLAAAIGGVLRRISVDAEGCGGR